MLKVIKRIKMIVITKNKLYSVVALVFIIIFCAVSVFFVAREKSITAFYEYKPILKSQLTGIEIAENSEKTDKLSSIYRKIVKYFFMLEETDMADEDYYNDEEGLKGELIRSEVKKVLKGMELSNATDIQININDYTGGKLAFSLDNQGPQILIIHTHTTESYSEENYLINASDRNLDEKKNIVAVGEAMAEVFERNGISVYHDKTVHDYPSYNGAYQRAATTIRNDLEAYHGIKVVLDVHRDGITKEDGTKVKLLTEINGKKTAQVMLVVGTDTNLPHDNWRENFKFAVKIQEKAIEAYPTLMRQINLRKERFNEQMTKGSLIVEVGTNGNTLDEALEGGRDIADVISAVLKEN